MLKGLILKQGSALLSLGVDLVEIDRIRALREKHPTRFLRWVYTEEEIDFCLKHMCADSRFATRFAAKEAVAKAFQVGIGGQLSWQCISISQTSCGAPCVLLSEQAKVLLERFHACEVLISLSHTKTTALAFAALTRKPSL